MDSARDIQNQIDEKLNEDDPFNDKQNVDSQIIKEYIDK